MRRTHKLLLAIAALGLLLVLPILWAANDLRSPQTHDHNEQYVEIPRRSSPSQIVSRLEGYGIVKRGWLLSLYIRLTGVGPKLRAGQYRFSSPITPLDVIRKLETGEQRLSRLTIVEGWTRWDIAELLARMPELKLSSSQEALELMNDTSDIRDIDPRADNLEGYLFPDTYSFPPDTTAGEVIATMVRRFRQIYEDEKQKSTGSTTKSTRELVTIASLIETEAKLKDERPIISSVIYNRLEKGMALGIDSTLIYASKLAGKWRDDGKVYLSDVERPSPYNTRRVTGLPPGPIASPGASSLAAALSPASTRYLYYVREPARDDGAHNFYESDADFSRGVQTLRSWETERNSNPVTSPSPPEK